MKANYVMIFFVLGVLCFCGCVQNENDSGEEYCIKEETGEKMSLEEALQIAKNSDCATEGNLKESYFCNQNSGTWWIDLDIEKEGCNPACVIDVVSREAEINWRCTGAMPPGKIGSFDECVDAGYPVMESYPRQCRLPDGTTFTEILDEPVEPNQPIGGQRDEHGCLGSAGYTFNEEIGACVREWELDENARKAAKVAVAPLSFPVTVAAVEGLDCSGCFVVLLRRNDNDHDIYVRLGDWQVVETRIPEIGEVEAPEPNESEQPIPLSEGMEIVEASNLLAIDLYKEYMSEAGNIFLSPYSITTALQMTYEGARGSTAEEMTVVLHLPDNESLRRQQSHALYNQINRAGKNYTLSTANALWAQEGYDFLPEYFGVVGEYYGGKVTNLDFVTKTEESRQIINTWVEQQTNDRIKDLIPDGVLGPMTRLVLTNAIYFKGEWVKQFDPEKTTEMDFRTGSGDKVKADMMISSGEESRYRYAENENLQILELPYSGDELSMLVLLPSGDDIAPLEDSLDTEILDEWRNSLRAERVDVYLPKFKFETKYSMGDTLKAMGMSTAFSSSADFSGMTGRKDLFISDVIHQAFVEVNEEGTEAAAATAVVMKATSAGPGQKMFSFKADHPFIFLIQQKDTGNILFMGRVDDPTV